MSRKDKLLITFVIGLYILILVIISAFAIKIQAYKDYSINLCRLSPTPTENPCVFDGGEDDIQCITPLVTPPPSVMPTDTPTPEVTETPTPVINILEDVAGQSAQGDFYTPSCTVPFDAPKLQGFGKDINGNPVFSWWKSTDQGITKQSIIYGYEKDKPLYGVADLPPTQTHIILHGLDTTKIIWAQVWSWKGDCVEKSEWLDP